MDEREILQMICNPDTVRDGYSRLVALYGEKLYWQIRRIVDCHEDANDILQNTFVKAWLKLGEFENRSKLSTWLTRIAINEALDFKRKQKRVEGISADESPSYANMLMADEYFDGNRAEALLQEAIAMLPDVQRTVFTLRYYDEMKYSEISKVLSTSEGALKASYHLAMKKIQEYVKMHE